MTVQILHDDALQAKNPKLKRISFALLIYCMTVMFYSN